MSTPSVLSSPDKKDIDEAGPTSKKDDLKATKTESSEENITDEGTTDKNHSDNEEEEMEDLFGGEDENEEATSDSKDADNIDAVEESNEDDETKKSEGNEEENLQRAALTLSRHPRSHTPMNDDVIMFNLPRFISVDPEPFSPTNFEEQLKEFIKEKEQEGEGSKDNATTNGIKDSIQFRKLQLLLSLIHI